MVWSRGSGGGLVDAAGGRGVGGACDGVAGNGVGVVDAHMSVAADVVVVKESAGQGDGAHSVEVDGDGVLVGFGALGEGGDRADSAVAHVRRGLAGRVQVAVGDPGDDAVTDAVAAGPHGGAVVGGGPPRGPAGGGGGGGV